MRQPHPPLSCSLLCLPPARASSPSTPASTGMTRGVRRRDPDASLALPDAPVPVIRMLDRRAALAAPPSPRLPPSPDEAPPDELLPAPIVRIHWYPSPCGVRFHAASGTPIGCEHPLLLQTSPGAQSVSRSTMFGRSNLRIAAVRVAAQRRRDDEVALPLHFGPSCRRSRSNIRCRRLRSHRAARSSCRPCRRSSRRRRRSRGKPAYRHVGCRALRCTCRRSLPIARLTLSGARAVAAHTVHAMAVGALIRPAAGRAVRYFRNAHTRGAVLPCHAIAVRLARSGAGDRVGVAAHRIAALLLERCAGAVALAAFAGTSARPRGTGHRGTRSPRPCMRSGPS